MSADAHVSLWIDGTPAPQGSKTGVRRGDRVVLIEGGSATGRRKHRAGRDACTAAALPHRRPDADAERPVEVEVTFVLPLPKSYAKWRHGTEAYRKPDLDKLIRSTLDGLADGGMLPGDDQRVCRVTASKRYQAQGEAPGAYVDVWWMDEPQRGAA